MTLSNVEKAKRYAADVLSGKEPACRWVRLACERQVRDLERAAAGDFRYVFDEERAERPCKVIEGLPHTKGKWSANRELLQLEGWQAFIITTVFGWVDRNTGMRRFREAFILVPRKNGKSALTSGTGVYMFAFDNESGAEIYCNATTEKQAWEVFGPAKIMVERTPPLKKAKGIQVNARSMFILEQAAKFEPVIGKPGDGSSPSMGIVDEYHEHQTSDAHDTLQTGMGAREQPLMWVISTAGSDIAGPCYAKQLEVQDILSGAVEAERVFACIWTIDAEDDWSDPAVLRKANPNMGVSVGAEYLQEQQLAAIRNPRDQAKFKTKHLNVWVNARDAYFNGESWLRCPGAPEIHELAGRECVIALDLASKTDIASLEVLFDVSDMYGDGHKARYGRIYLPSVTIDDPKHAHYQQWRERGELDETDGNVIDFARIEEDVKDLCAEFRVLAVGFDPYQGTYLSTRLQDDGVPMLEYRMSVETMSDPMKSLDADIISGKLHHNCGTNHPMTWMMGNVTAKADRKDNVYPTKETADKKIDGPVALIQCYGLMANAEPGTPYDGRDLLVI
jgi:phage terminase large subunit-like protein